MVARTLATRDRVYIGLVIAAGVSAAVSLLPGVEVRDHDWPAIVVFAALGILASAVSLTHRGTRRSSMTYQIGSSFAYPLLVLVDTGVVCAVFLLMTLADKLINRRSWLTTTFNIGQLWLACWIAGQVQHLIRPDFVRFDRLDLQTVLLAAASFLAFAVVNHTLTQGVTSLVNRRPFFPWTWFTRTGVLNETICLVSGLGMAVFWWVEPWLVLLGAIPIWSMIFLNVLLNRREQALERRETELHSLQDLGLELGAELEAQRLHEAVVNIAREAFDASCCMLGIKEERRPDLSVLACRGGDGEPPERLPLAALGQGSIESGRIRRVLGSPSEPLHELFSRIGAKGLMLAPLEIHGRRTGVLVLLHDETRRPFDEDDQRRLETLVRFLNMALSNAQLVTRLKDVQTQLIQTEKMSAVGVLVAGVAHELNNPLTSVLGYAELLAVQEDDERKQRMLERIGLEARRAGKIVQKLLTFSRKSRPDKKAVDINKVLDDVLDFRQYDLALSNIEVVRRLEPDLPEVRVDPHQFHQVFLNLVTNAEHAIVETTLPGTITVESMQLDNVVRVAIADSGPGIPPEHLRQVFLPFFTTKEIGRGTGLGLSICYGIVEGHGGRIGVDSEPGRGSTFRVDIPLSEAGEAESTAT
jgi:signal transduction histidine kinase